jgi:integrase
LRREVLKVEQLPKWAVVVREMKDGSRSYEVTWRSRVEHGRTTKRRIGAAWVERDATGAWVKRGGRTPAGYLEPRTAPVRAAEIVAEVEASKTKEAKAAADAASRPLTFRQVAHEWLDELRREAKPATVRDYASVLREPGAQNKRGSGKAAGRVMAAFGDRPIESITAREVADFLKTLDEAGFTARNVNKYRQTMSVVYSYASRADTYELEFNPVVSVRKRREPAPSALEYYEVHEAELLARALADGLHRPAVKVQFDTDELFLRAIEDARDADFIRVLFYTGMRLGEARTLRWKDIDLEARQVCIRRGVSAGEEVDTPKGGRVRWAPLPKPAVEVFSRQRNRQDFASDDDYVFCARDGSMLDDSALRRRYKAAAKAVGLRPLKLHGLRHAAGSILARRATAVEVRDTLGHAKLSTTDRYVSARYSEDFFERMDEAFTPKQPSKPDPKLFGE